MNRVYNIKLVVDERCVKRKLQLQPVPAAEDCRMNFSRKLINQKIVRVLREAVVLLLYKITYSFIEPKLEIELKLRRDEPG